MRLLLLVGITALSTWTACTNNTVKEHSDASLTSFHIAGAMRNVMHKGELDGIISLDSIGTKKGLYGIGPLEQLRGELLLFDGQSFVSTVNEDSSMAVTQSFDAKAPFFVYAHQNEWREQSVTQNVANIKELEEIIIQAAEKQSHPFVFKLSGQIEQAQIHVQNLAPGTKVSSPAEAHSGQVNYTLGIEQVDIVGFYSTIHQGVFTHHDSYMHLHLITKDRKSMGHLDDLVFYKNKVTLHLPK
ncbi:MAG: acetolactate decarboxylase [Bacteroidota bacterium]